MIRDPRHIYRSPLLDEIPWLRHGFGTRHQEDWPGAYTRLKQTHSDIIVDAGSRRGTLGEGDALVTAEGGNWIGIRTADCVPLLLADTRNKVVAAVHAGWRGTASRIAAKTVHHLKSAYGTKPSDIVAALGPAIGGCCYEVGADVAARFEELQPGALASPTLDLVAINRRLLLEAGVVAIDGAALCSKCLAGEFHSYRRDRGIAGRMVSAIQVNP